MLQRFWMHLDGCHISHILGTLVNITKERLCVILQVNIIIICYMPVSLVVCMQTVI